MVLIYQKSSGLSGYSEKTLLIGSLWPDDAIISPKVTGGKNADKFSEISARS